MATTTHNSFDTPRGGCPSRLATNEIECSYCAAAISRATANRTCPLCTKEWEAMFGPTWFEQSWHADLLASHITAFGGNGRGKAVSLDAVPVEQAATEIEPLPTGRAGVVRDPVIYAAVKDILIVAQARDEWSILSKVANKVRPHELAQLPSGTIGAARMRKLLIERGFRVRKPNETKRSPMYIPANRTLEHYIAAARSEISDGDYFTAPVAPVLDKAA